jgi:hypothetical protein
MQGLRRSQKGRKLPSRVRPRNDRLQYVQDIQSLTINVRLGLNTGHPIELLRYLSRSEGVNKRRDGTPEEGWVHLELNTHWDCLETVLAHRNAIEQDRC